MSRWRPSRGSNIWRKIRMLKRTHWRRPTAARPGYTRLPEAAVPGPSASAGSGSSWRAICSYIWSVAGSAGRSLGSPQRARAISSTRSQSIRRAGCSRGRTSSRSTTAPTPIATPQAIARPTRRGVGVEAGIPMGKGRRGDRVHSTEASSGWRSWGPIASTRRGGVLKSWVLTASQYWLFAYTSLAGRRTINGETTGIRRRGPFGPEARRRQGRGRCSNYHWPQGPQRRTRQEVRFPDDHERRRHDCEGDRAGGFLREHGSPARQGSREQDERRRG